MKLKGSKETEQQSEWTQWRRENAHSALNKDKLI